MAKRKKRNNLFIYAILIITLVLMAMSLFIVFNKEAVLDVVRHEVRFIVLANSSTGFDANGSILAFGRTSQGGAGITRYVNITNGYDFPIRAEISASRDIAKALLFEELHFIGINEGITVPIHLVIPDSFEDGNYSGVMEFRIYRAA